MPRNEIDYSKTIIYKIVCNDLTITDCYVGSTTDFKTRKAGHKSNCNNENGRKYDLKVYKMIRDNGGWSNWTMLQIELYPCKDSNEAHSRERHWIEYFNSKLNMNIPTREKKEWRDEHLEDEKLYNAKYYDEHKDERHIDGKQKIHCPSCNCMVGKWNFSKHNKTEKHIKNLKPNDEIIETL